jgi:hypothetical protein
MSLRDLAGDRLTVDAAAHIDGAGRRQIYWLRRVFSADAPAGLASRKRGRRATASVARPSGHGSEPGSRTLHRLRTTLAAEKLIARRGPRIGVETLRQWMMAEGLWVDPVLIVT